MYAQFLLGRALRSQSLSGIFFQNDCLQGNYDVKHIGYTETDLLSPPPTRQGSGEENKKASSVLLFSMPYLTIWWKMKNPHIQFLIFELNLNNADG